MNHHIYHLRTTQLPEQLSYQLAPFISSYRPHDLPPTKKDLDPYDRKDSESVLSKENILDTYKAIKYEQDLEWLKLKREHNKKWKGYRTSYDIIPYLLSSDD